MSVGILARRAGWLAFAIALPVALGQAAGGLGVLVGVVAVSVVALVVWLWLPRTAHAAFEAGKVRRASRAYWVLAATAVTAQRRRYSQLSRVACADGAEADRLLGRLEPGAFDVTERAVWLNNRAYALLTEAASDARSGDPRAALALADEATELRPDVPAVQHTRGLALLALGRLDEAIAVLDGMRTAGELPSRLEAARCRDLARAWTAKGELAYAEDYRSRAATLEARA